MSKSNIDWCDWSWNPITGCYHNCAYCYARKIARRFSSDYRKNINDERCIKYSSDKSKPLFILEEPFISRNNRALATPFDFNCTFHKYRLNDLETLKKGRNIFVGSMADVFGEWVPDEWIYEIFNTCKKYPQHNYLFLTKNPHRYSNIKLPTDKNMWYGFTADTTKRDIILPVFINNANTFISIEPLLEDIGKILLKNWDRPIANWIIVGAETGNRRGKVIPPVEWINNITKYADRFHIPVFMKESLIPIVGEENIRREFPEGFTDTRLGGKRKEQWMAFCGVCKKEYRKADMVSILGRKGRGESAVAIGFVCNNCYDNFVKGLNSNEVDRKGSEGVGDKAPCTT